MCFVLKTPLTNVAKSARITNLTRFTTLEKKKPREASKCPQISNIGKEEAKKGLEMSANVAKIAKVTRIFLAGEELASQIWQKSQE